MPQKRLSMRKIKEVLRLRFGLGLRPGPDRPKLFHRSGDRSSISGEGRRCRPDAGRCRKITMTGGSMSCCFRRGRSRPPASHAGRPGLRRNPPAAADSTNMSPCNCCGKSIAKTHPDGYGYSRFCELYQRWSRNQNVVLRQDHKAGEKMFVDWAGPTVPISRHAERARSRRLRCSSPCSGASTYTFAHAALSQHLANWIDCHVARFRVLPRRPPSSSCPITRAPASIAPAAMSRISTALITRWRSTTARRSCRRGPINRGIKPKLKMRFC